MGLHDRLAVLPWGDAQMTILGAILGGLFCLAAGLVVGVFRDLTK
jgi:hypothetical protein